MSIAEHLTRELFAALARRDVAAVSELIAPDAVWRFPGRKGALAGTHQGREAIFGFLIKVAALTEETFHAEPIEIVANDKVAFYHFYGRGERAGMRLGNDTCLRLEFAEGRLV